MYAKADPHSAVPKATCRGQISSGGIPGPIYGAVSVAVGGHLRRRRIIAAARRLRGALRGSLPDTSTLRHPEAAHVVEISTRPMRLVGSLALGSAQANAVRQLAG